MCVQKKKNCNSLVALKQFTARRDLPTELYSENGSNDLSEFYKFLSTASTQSSINDHLLSNQVSWMFSPERAPQFGGLWEAAVKSAKHNLKRIIGQQKLTFEEFTMVLCQVESCLNSRSLLPISTHSDDGIEVLTPGHFLILGSLHLKAY